MNKILTATAAYELISSVVDSKELFISIDESDSMDYNLGTLLGLTANGNTLKKKIPSGEFIATRNDGSSIKVNLEIINNIETEIILKVSTDASNTLIDLTDDGRWMWDIKDEFASINWGDGTETTVSEENIFKHNYSIPGEYKIEIKNICWRGGNGNTYDIAYRQEHLPIKELTFAKKQIIKNPNNLFGHMNKLEKIEGVLKLADSRNGYTMGYTFANCTALKDVSKLTIIYNDMPEGTTYTMNQTFANCSALTDKGLSGFRLLNIDLDKIITYNSAFNGCKGLTKVPTNIIGSGASTLMSTFCNSGISYLPSNIMMNVSELEDTFESSPMKYISGEIKLDNLIKTYHPFFKCPLNFESIKVLYNALPAVPDTFTPLLKENEKDDKGRDIPTGEDENDNDLREYTFYFSYDSAEDGIIEKIAELMDLSLENGELPIFSKGNYRFSKNGWVVTFEPDNTTLA
jgi:hypothetical protein